MNQPNTDGQVLQYAAVTPPVTLPFIYYVNGIQTDAQTHAQTATSLSVLTERVVFGVYNASAVRRLCLFLLFCVTAVGCGSVAEDSRQNMHKLQLAMHEFAIQNGGNWPERLDQLKELVGGDAVYRTIMKNPLTGDDPGYEYETPQRLLGAKEPYSRIVVLHQLRGGKRDTSLKVGYADGSVRQMGTD
ncbi:MAG: hypothetical protein L0215_11800 [Gemmataceae bacterium]|nr:hypothetical protein [Gemmataceae bacterium]